jgi:hypothetical protein
VSVCDLSEKEQKRKEIGTASAAAAAAARRRRGGGDHVRTKLFRK